MRYPKLPDYNTLTGLLTLQAQLKTEYGAKGISGPLARAERALRAALRELQGLPADRELARRESNDLKAILALRQLGPRRMWPGLNSEVYRDRLAGAFLGEWGVPAWDTNGNDSPNRAARYPGSDTANTLVPILAPLEKHSVSVGGGRLAGFRQPEGQQVDSPG